MATFSASATATVQVAATYNRVDTLVTASEAPRFSVTQSLSSSDVSKVVQRSYTATSGVVTLDLTSVTDDYGQTLAFSNLKGAYLYNNHASGTLVVGGGSNPVFGSDQYTVKAGSIIPITSAFAVSGGAKNLLVTPSVSMSWQLFLVGN